MKKQDVVQLVLGKQYQKNPVCSFAKSFAPTNIALCKYWGKRNQELNLPITSSLSVSLAHKGATTEIKVNDKDYDVIYCNFPPLKKGDKRGILIRHPERSEGSPAQQEILSADSPFAKKLIEYLNLFRTKDSHFFDIYLETNIPIAAGLASSACGFAAMIQALNHLYDWQLSPQALSILARLGSGSASRSVFSGFVEWHMGDKIDGMDSYAELLPDVWPELCMGLLIVSDQEKTISSREAMQLTVETSSLYSVWPKQVKKDLAALKQAISAQDFILLGQTAETNAMSMHATMLSACPSITYYLPETLVLMKKIWQLRKEGLPVYFTQDAGANLKLLFEEKQLKIVSELFPKIEIIKPFSSL